MSGRMAQCSNLACITRSGRRRRFSAANKRCPTCNSPAQVLGGGSGKGGGKGGSVKSFRHYVANTGRSTRVRKRRPKKMLVKWDGLLKDDRLKPAPGKSLPRKRI